MSKHKHQLTPVSTGSFKSYDGTKIYYECHGQGEPIVLVYGIACLANHYHFQVEHFSKNYQVILFDLRGHHNSEVPADPSQLTLSAIGKDITALMRSLGHKKAHFIGHSFGAPALLAAYEEAASMFSSMTFINGFAKNPIKGMFGLDVVEPFFYFVRDRFQENPTLWNALWKTFVDNPLTALGTGIAGGFNMKVTPFKDIEIYAKGVSQIPLNVFLPLFEDMMHFDGTAVAQKVSCPTLIMSGEKDMVTPHKFQLDLHETIPHSEFVTIAYGSHCCQLDFPEFVNLKIEKFLTGNDEL